MLAKLINWFTLFLSKSRGRRREFILFIIKKAYGAALPLIEDRG